MTKRTRHAIYRNLGGNQVLTRCNRLFYIDQLITNGCQLCSDGISFDRMEHKEQ